MPRTIITNASVILPDHVAEHHAVILEAGRIASVLPLGNLPAETDAQVVDAGGMYLAPGFIDLHIHGLHEYLVDHGPEDLAGIGQFLPTYGVTGFLPTLCPRPKGEDAEFLATLSRVRPAGAQVMGFHLEGPFLSLTGALPAEAIGTADAQRARSLVKAADPYPAIFSIAPEFEGILDLLPIMTGGSTPAFITHTCASVKQTQAAIEAGARHATHFYDVFPCPPETEPGARPCGAVEAVLADPRVSVDFILDGEHVDPVAVHMALLCKGCDKVCLITDANVGAGLPPGTYEFGGNKITFAYPGGPARSGADSPYPGGLAGSGLTLDRAVRNAIRLLGVDIPLAIRMASRNPAAVLGLAGTKGTIAEGFHADLVLLDRELHVQKTWIGGKPAFAAPPHQKG